MPRKRRHECRVANCPNYRGPFEICGVHFDKLPEILRKHLWALYYEPRSQAELAETIEEAIRLSSAAATRADRNRRVRREALEA